MTPNGNTVPTTHERDHVVSDLFSAKWCDERHDRIGKDMEEITGKLDGLTKRIGEVEQRLVRVFAIGGTLVVLASLAVQLVGAALGG